MNAAPPPFREMISAQTTVFSHLVQAIVISALGNDEWQ